MKRQMVNLIDCVLVQMFYLIETLVRAVALIPWMEIDKKNHHHRSNREDIELWEKYYIIEETKRFKNRYGITLERSNDSGV